MRSGISISKGQITEYRKGFSDNPANRILMNAIIKNGVEAVSINNESMRRMQYTFSEEMETPKITDQKSSGRCWLFAGLNVIRLNVVKKCSMKEFELSQSYQMFWDKLEKSNYFLENILSTIDEDIRSRIVMWLLGSPIGDGGQWDMFVNIIEKYGIAPKYAMPETFHSSKSAIMNRLITVKLREFASILRKEYRDGKSIRALHTEKKKMLGEIYNMLCLFLGVPPESFDFEYRDKDKKFHRDASISPIKFYEKYAAIDIGDYVSIINAPTEDKPYNQTFTVKFLGNVMAGKNVLYLNVDIDTMKKLAVKQIKKGEPVWFGCDVGKFMDKDSGIMDMNLYDFNLALNVTFNMTKGDRLDYGESLMTHAMVLTGVNIVDGKPNRWKVENSWGEKTGNKGFFIMNDNWFNEYLYQVVIHREYLPKKLLHALEKKPIVLPPWDPMGSLAK